MRKEFERYAGKTVLVTGATGFTGRQLTHKLVAAGARIRIIARPSSSAGDLADIDAEWFRGEVFDEQVVARAAKGVHYIFHLAAAYRENHPDVESYREVHLHSTQLLARAVQDNPDFQCFLQVSTVGVHGHIEAGSADETYRFEPGDSYQLTKLEAEQWLYEYATGAGLPFSIVRPGPIFGPGDLRLLKVFRMVSRGYFLMIGSGKGWYQMIHVDDLTNIIMLAAVVTEARSEALIATGDEAIRLVDLARLIGRKINKSVRIIRLPVWPFYLLSDICGLLCKPFGISPPIYRRRVDFYTKDRRFNNAKVKKLLNYQFQYDNDRGVEETANWYIEHKLIR